MYVKRWTNMQTIQKSSDSPAWVRWVHHAEGKTHCEECLMLDGCWFLKEKTPKWPHHPFCHCTLDPIGYAVVLLNAVAYSDYSKFDPFLFNTAGNYTHSKERLFKEWGYTVDDAKWLQAEIEKQARLQYVSGKYELGKLDDKGQRISIRVAIPRRDNGEYVSFITGWMVYPNGRLQLTTPYGGK